jgi:hypothetical protein
LTQLLAAFHGYQHALNETRSSKRVHVTYGPAGTAEVGYRTTYELVRISIACGTPEQGSINSDTVDSFACAMYGSLKCALRVVDNTAAHDS